MSILQRRAAEEKKEDRSGGNQTEGGAAQEEARETDSSTGETCKAAEAYRGGGDPVQADRRKRVRFPIDIMNRKHRHTAELTSDKKIFNMPGC